ncbi:putative ABC transporter G family member 28-like [Cocos nucifera]|uniref:Putative ABC transporter G family member 28-like n=1 Tax=Cocos nucifera TaxID=13894 RepID=A0A8K0IFL6_COCNU|nr:putative ABC transporter G family member 28-like [Cocos nucifera]
MPGRWVTRIPLAGVIAAVILLGRLTVGCCQVDGGYDGSDRVRSVYSRVMNLTSGFVNEASKKLGFCIKNQEEDWNGAFDFSADMGYLEKCMEETQVSVSILNGFLAVNSCYNEEKDVQEHDEKPKACNSSQRKIPEIFDHTLAKDTITNYLPESQIILVVVQIGCYIKSSCKPNSENQNITLFGALLMVALSLLLLIIYNFSGQIITFHKRKQAKSREAAARMARKTVQARERWKKVKGIAKKHAAGLQNQLSCTFPRQRSVEQQEELKFLSQSEQSSAASTSKNKEPDDAIKMMHSLEEYSDSEGFSLEIEDKNFNKRLVSMVTADEIRTRPMIEVVFRDLTLSLKGKQLLRCVTGKLMPGRVTAVMGPSGAGKTTFLNALAGRTTGYEMSGLVLINGKVEPIRAYKKIIGFVPQDDVVHGNLTVEENLWFTARCRLSADMPKADKVLVVERVIEYLGLQAVRDSLVGTVEKRGISGGQRKRVNVGLEMVIEPSLLILDEPTSGLDSSSSQLLLRALRREALEGMFDDLILLAKGGLTVYHGAVEKVEEYFANLGINVPKRVNPPDYYIDILEGITKPGTSMAVTCKVLPLRWMLHNRYEIPPDMQHHLGRVDTSSGGGRTNSSRDGSDGQSVADEVCGNANAALTLKQYHMANNFSKLKDLSNRRTPGILVQYKYYMERVMKQRLREARTQVVDFLILGLAGVCLGMLAKVRDETFGLEGYTYTVIAVSLLCKIGALRSFSLEKLQYWRERASGMSSLAYFLSKDTIDHFNTAIKPIIYLSMFYFVNNPRSSIADNYATLVALVYCVTGIGYIFAICFQPGNIDIAVVCSASCCFDFDSNSAEKFKASS